MNMTNFEKQILYTIIMAKQHLMSKYYLPEELEPHLIIKPQIYKLRNLVAQYIHATEARDAGYIALTMLYQLASRQHRKQYNEYTLLQQMNNCLRPSAASYFTSIRDQALVHVSEEQKEQARKLKKELYNTMSNMGEIKLYVFYQLIFVKLLSEIDRSDGRKHNAYGRIRQTLGTPQCILAQVIAKWMNPLPNTIVFNPNSGFGYASCALPNSCHFIGGNDSETLNRLAELFTMDYARNICILDHSYPNIDTFDYLIWFADSDKQAGEVEYSAEEYKRVFGDYLNRLPEHGKAACVISNEFWQSPDSYDIRKNIIESDLVDRILYLSEGWSITFLDKKHSHKGSVKLINARYSRMTVKALENILNNELAANDIPLSLIRQAGYRITNQQLFEQEIRLSDCTNKRIIQLKDVLTAYKSHQYAHVLDNLQRVEFKPRADYSPYYAVIDHLDSLSDAQTELLLANIFSVDYFQPYVLKVPQNHPPYYHEEYEIFTIQTDKIKAEYLVGELNKDYFKRQLYSGRYNEARNNYSENVIDLFLSLYIYVPDCQTPLEREGMLYQTDYLKYLYEWNKSYGYNMDEAAKGNKRYLPNGKWLRNKYQIENRITRGGFGMTYKARKYEYVNEQMVATDVVAIKEFFMEELQTRDPNTLKVSPRPTEQLDDFAKAQEKFQNEASIIREFQDCPHIINVYDTFNELGTCYYVMEYIEGYTLEEWCLEHTEQGYINEKRALEIIRQIASALKEIHSRNMNHLDVKPGNIMIDCQHNNRVVLIDFGTAHVFSPGAENTLDFLPVRSGAFTAPEITSLRFFSPAPDIYSLGAILYFLLTGQEPEADFSENPEKDFTDHLEEVSPETRFAIRSAMNHEPTKRPQNTDDFLALLPKME